MKTIQDVIELAVEGGWKHEFVQGDVDPASVAGYISIQQHLIASTVIDPLFWQALGKELGWKEAFYFSALIEEGEAQFHARKMIDHLFEGGEIEDYLISLIEE